MLFEAEGSVARNLPLPAKDSPSQQLNLSNITIIIERFWQTIRNENKYSITTNDDVMQDLGQFCVWTSGGAVSIPTQGSHVERF